MSFARARFTAPVVFALLLALAPSCRDEGAERLARAKLQYEQLLSTGARPTAKEFDAVLADLESVPETSRHRAEAQKLAAAIKLGRNPVRTPLALNPRSSRSPELDAQLRACARLAELAGADGGVDRRALEALEQCRRRAELLELKWAHGEEDGGEGP